MSEEKMTINFDFHLHCPVCGTTANYMTDSIIATPDFGSPDVCPPYYKCDWCGIYYHNPTIQRVESFYSTQYRKLLFPPNGEPPASEIVMEKKRALRQTLYLRKFAPSLPIETHLDVGAGLGYLSDLLLQNGVVSSSQIVEPDDMYRERALSERKIVGFKYLKEVTGVYDLITLSHVLEHQSYPIQFMAEVLSHLKLEGQILIDVPNARVNRNAFRVYHPVAFHWDSLRRFLSEVGLEFLVKTTYGDSWQPLDDNLLCLVRRTHATG